MTHIHIMWKGSPLASEMLEGMKRKKSSQQTYHDSEPTVAYLQCVVTHNTEYPRSHAGNCEPIGAIARKVPRGEEHDTADL
jgi:hypothetical protein